jgi:hypothetical protein
MKLLKSNGATSGTTEQSRNSINLKINQKKPSVKVKVL